MIRKKNLISILSVIVLLMSSSIVIGKVMAWLYVVSELSPNINSAQVGGGYFERGDGSQTNPFVIKTEKHLSNLAWLQYYGKIDAEYYYEIDDSITSLDCSTYIPPIGTKLHPFNGKFNGNGKVIKNLRISTDSNRITNLNNTDTFSGVGLFGEITSPAVVSNFNISGAIIETGNKSEDTAKTGYICGVANGGINSVGVYNSSIYSNGMAVSSGYGLVGSYDEANMTWTDKPTTGSGNDVGGPLVLDAATYYNKWPKSDSTAVLGNNVIEREANANGEVYMKGELKAYNDKKYTEFNMINNVLHMRCSGGTYQSLSTIFGTDYNTNPDKIRIIQTLWIDAGNTGKWTEATSVGNQNNTCVIRFNTKSPSSSGTDTAKVIHFNPNIDGVIRILITNKEGSKDVTFGIRQMAGNSNATVSFQEYTCPALGILYIEYNVKATDINGNKLRYEFYNKENGPYVSYIELGGASNTGGGSGSTTDETKIIKDVDFVASETTIPGSEGYVSSNVAFKIETTTVSGRVLYVTRQTTGVEYIGLETGISTSATKSTSLTDPNGYTPITTV